MLLNRHDIDEEFEKVFGDDQNHDTSAFSEDSIDESDETIEAHRFAHRNYQRWGKALSNANGSIPMIANETTTGRSLRLRGINKVAYAKRKYNELSRVLTNYT